MFLYLQTMLNKFHKYPCVAYVTEPKGCKLSYGQRVEVLYLSGNGRYAITKHGRYETIRFSKEPPSDFLINPQPYVPEKRQGYFIKSYKQLYYELLERAKESVMNGTEKQFCQNLLKTN